MCAALANVEEDSWEWHTFDTVKGGDYLVDQPAAEIMCREAIDAVIELEHFGLPFNRTPEGSIDQRRFGGHTRNHGEAPVRRACYSADRTGHMILQTLFQQCVQRERQLLQRVPGPRRRVRRATGAERRVAAVVAYELATGDLHVFHTKAVLFAIGWLREDVQDLVQRPQRSPATGRACSTGGASPWRTWSSSSSTRRASTSSGILLSEAARGEGGILRNCDGERFMERYAPTVKDLAPRDMVCRADLHRDPRGPWHAGRTRTTSTSTSPTCRRSRSTPSCPTSPTSCGPTWASSRRRDPIPIQPTAHYAMGGIPTNIHGEVVIDADEHGAPRPLRRGRVRVRVGARRQPARHQLAARHRGVRPAGRAGHGRVRRERADARAPGRAAEDDARSRIERLNASTGGENIADIRRRLQDEMMDKASVFRTEESLAEMLDVLADLKDRYERVGDRRQGRGLQLRPHRGARARLPARPGRVPRGVGPGPHREPRRPLAGRPPAARRRELDEAHARVRLEDDGSVRLDYKPVESGKLPTHGTEVLMVSCPT